MRKHTTISLRVLAAITLFVLSSGVTFVRPIKTYALPAMDNRFDRMSSSIASANATHVIGFSITETSTVLGSIEIEFCTNDALPGTPCTPPPGLSLTGANLSNQTGNVGFSIHPSSNANRIVLSRFPILPVGAASTYEFSDVTNPDTAGSHFIRLRTYSSNDATGGAIEEGGIAFSINTAVSVAAEVPPYLRFCASTTIVNYDCSTATSFYINLGEFSTSTPTVSSSEFVLATNAGSGLTVTISGTTLTSGNNMIPGLTPGSPSLSGASQFGINLRANTSPSIGAEPSGPGTATVRPEYNTANVFRFVTNESLVSTSTTSDNRKFTVSYMTNISDGQSPGVYATTLSFICLANF